MGSPVEVLWAKTARHPTPSPSWHPLRGHLLDSMSVAQALWDSWLSPHTRHSIDATLPGGQGDGRRLLGWLAGLHDLGKASPAFQVQAPDRAAAVRDVLDLPGVVADRRLCPHGTASGVALVDLLESAGWSRRGTRWVASIVQGHHGVFGNETWLIEAQRRPWLVGEGGWAQARRDLFDEITDRSGARSRLADWSSARVPEAVQLLLAGLVILSDWCASTESCFPYRASLPPDYPVDAQRQARQAPARLDWGQPWRPTPGEPTSLIERRFGFRPRTVQQATVDLVQSMTGPGLVVVEAPMGEGKTEAALAAAELLAYRHGCTGLFVGLPTQATSTSMFARLLGWLMAQESTATVALAHSGARRVASYEALLTAPSDVHGDGTDSGITASQWFAGSKRPLLAPVVVGTVDQLLLAAVKARHVSLRHAGLAGKVVIVDEVHAYDAYMSVFLDRALSWLGAAGIPVVLLSATLPPVALARLTAAYRLGLEQSGGGGTDGTTAYPRLTTADARGVTIRPVQAGTRAMTVELEMVDEPEDEGALVAETVASAVEKGGCVLIVRNTVVRAQETYRALRGLLPSGEVTLIHARFTAVDRQAREHSLLDRFGPEGQRPTRHVVVATQVVEQSLDVDFDLLVTDLCPVDLLLQRVGRLHRHDRLRPAGLSEARVVVAGQRGSGTGVPAFPRGSMAVYGDHLLLRTAATLDGRRELRVPLDVPILVAAVYGDDPVGPPAWSSLLAVAQQRWAEAQDARRVEADRYALRLPKQRRRSLDDLHDGGGAEASDDDPTIRAHVRDGDPSVTVLMLELADGIVLLPGGATFAFDEPVPPDRLPEVLDQEVRLPAWLTAAALENCPTPPAWGSSGWLGRQRALLLLKGAGQVGDVHLRYDDDLGLEVSRGRRVQLRPGLRTLDPGVAD